MLWQRQSEGGPSEGSPLAQGARELYRLLPALAMGLAGLAIVVTLAQALLARAPVVAAPPARAGATASPTAAVVATEVPTEASTVAVAELVPTALAAPVLPAAVPPTSVPSAAPTAVATAAATPVPASMELTVIAPRRVRAQGRIAAPADDTAYWFLIREPERTGVFRQGPAQVNAQGAFVFDLDLQQLNVGPDSVVLAAVPEDTSLTWTRQALQTGSWLPVIDLRQGDGVVFLREVGL